MPIDRNRFVNFLGAPDLSVTRRSVSPQPDIPVEIPPAGFFLLTESGATLLTESRTGIEPEGEYAG